MKWISDCVGGACMTTYRTARRIAVAFVGASVLLIGVVLLVTPGPAFIVIPIGLGILAIEFEWARRWLASVRDVARNGLRRTDGPAVLLADRGSADAGQTGTS
jgi:hypothetical protein